MFTSCFINYTIDKDFINILNSNNYNLLINFLKINNINNKKIQCYISQSISQSIKNENKIIYYLLVLSIYFPFTDFKINNINNKKIQCYISQSINKEDKIIYYLLVLSIYFPFTDFNIYCEPKLSFEKEYIINLMYNESNCITFTINQTSNIITIDSLDKCGNNNGNKLLNMIEQFANKINISKLKLLDGSHIYSCNERYKISLSMLAIFSSGKSWYNNLGYLSDNFNNEQTRNSELIKNKLVNIINFNKLNNNIKNTISTITSGNNINLNDISIEQLFKLIKKYLKSITNNCDEITINNIININNLIELLQVYIIYDYTLIKNISNMTAGSKKSKKKRKKVKKVKKCKTFKSKF